MNEVVYLYGKNGYVEVFNSKKDAALKLGYGFINNFVGYFLGNPSMNNNYYLLNDSKSYKDFIMKNDFNESLTIKDFISIFDEIRENKYVNLFSLRYKMSKWNCEGPVPGTGVKHYGRVMRRPKTLKTLKYATGIIEDCNEPTVRVRGGKSNIVTSWDDIWIYNQRSWKSHRKTQYKGT